MGEGVCLSACVLAFMGGKTRVYGPEGGPGARGLAIVSMAFDQPASVIGRPSADAMAAAGLPAGGMLRLAMEGYAAEMGVDPAIAGWLRPPASPAGCTGSHRMRPIVLVSPRPLCRARSGTSR